MQIAKIVSSHSHVEYAARVLDTLEVARPPAPADYAFGRFIGIDHEGIKTVGVIANSQLINPKYGNYGPRLSATPDANRLFAPDYLHDQGVLITLLLLGFFQAGVSVQQTPALVLPVHAPVSLLSDAERRAFHRDEKQQLKLGYYSQITRIGGSMAGALLQAIIAELEADAGASERAQLALLKRNLSWQQTAGAFASRRF